MHGSFWSFHARRGVAGPRQAGGAYGYWQENVGLHAISAEALRQAEWEWPSAIKAPELNSSTEVITRINNVFFGATGWILLHEIAHVHKKHESMSYRSVQQEEEADEFAASWVFEKVPTDRQREFRILAVGVALAWLLLFAPLRGDTKHPPAYSRLFHVSSYFGAAKDSVALEVVALLFKALFFPSMTTPTFQMPGELFDWTIQQLRERSI